MGKLARSPRSLHCWLWPSRSGRAFAGNKTQFARLSRATNTAVEEARQLSLQSRWDAAVKVLQAAESQLESGPQYQQLRRQLASAMGSYRKKQDERDSEDRDRKRQGARRSSHARGRERERR